MRHHKVVVFFLLILFTTSYSKTYRISTVNWAGWAFLDVADQKGFWKELGVNVELVHFEDGAIMHDKMIIGEVDLSMNMMPYTIWMHDKVKPVSVLMESNWSHGGDKIVVKDADTFKKGTGTKVIGIYLQGYPLEYFLQRYLRSIGRSLSEYSLVKMQPSELVNQFNVGRLQAIVIFEPLASKAVEGGNGEVVATTADFNGVIREGLYTFKKRLLSYPREDVVNIIRGIIRALRWIDDEKNQREFYTIVNEHTFFNEKEPYSDEVLAQMLHEVKVHTDLQTLSDQNLKELPLYFKSLLFF